MTPPGSLLGIINLARAPTIRPIRIVQINDMYHIVFLLSEINFAEFWSGSLSRTPSFVRYPMQKRAVPVLCLLQATPSSELIKREGPFNGFCLKGGSSLCSLAWPSLGQRGSPPLASFDVQFLVGELLVRPNGSLHQ